MKIYKTKIKDLLIIKQKNNKDKRGSLREIFNNKILKEKNFVFEYCTVSKKDALRGFHFQYKFQQVKLITVLKGKILDYVIDLRKNSKTFGKKFKIILSEKNLHGYDLTRIYAFLAERFTSYWFTKNAKYKTMNISFYDIRNNFN